MALVNECMKVQSSITHNNLQLETTGMLAYVWMNKQKTYTKDYIPVSLYLYEMSRIGKFMETESMLVVPWLSGERMGVN